MTKAAILFFLFVTALLLCQATLQFLFRKRIKLDARMREFVAAPRVEEKVETEKRKSIFHAWRMKACEYLESKTSPETKSELDKKLRDAGYPRSWTAIDFRIVQWISGGTLFFVVFILFMKISENLLLLCVLAGVVAAFGFYYPSFQLSVRKRKRMEIVRKTMAEFFDMVNLSVEAGMGLDAAIFRVCKNINGPLSDEFMRAIEDIRLGKSRRDAFIQLRNRIPLDLFQSIMTSLIQADKLGLSLSKALRAQTERIREHQRQAAREKAMKAPVKMLFPMLMFIFPSIFIVLLGPLVIYLLTQGLK